MTTEQSITCTIGGVDVEVSGLAYRRVASGAAPDRGFDAGPHVYEGSLTLERVALDRFLEVLTPRSRGASDATLAKRVLYGGRKGRSAMRRLCRKGFAGVITVDNLPPMPCPPVRIAWTTPVLASQRGVEWLASLATGREAASGEKCDHGQSGAIGAEEVGAKEAG